jgi:hypothetical protein
MGTSLCGCNNDTAQGNETNVFTYINKNNIFYFSFLKLQIILTERMRQMLFYPKKIFLNQ